MNNVLLEELFIAVSWRCSEIMGQCKVKPIPVHIIFMSLLCNPLCFVATAGIVIPCGCASVEPRL
jgi:hypothetical protein